MISVRKRIQFTCRRVFTILVGAICTFLISICSVSSDAKEPEISEQDLFFGFYHIPAFTYNACRISATITSVVGLPEKAANVLAYFDIFLREHHPNVALGKGNANWGSAMEQQLDVAFIGACDERELVTTTFLESFYAKEDVYVTIPDDAQGESFTFWTDSPSFDATYWGLRKDAAGTCDPALWAKVANFHANRNRQHDTLQEYLYSRISTRLGHDQKTMIQYQNWARVQISDASVQGADELISKYFQRKKCKE